MTLVEFDAAIEAACKKQRDGRQLEHEGKNDEMSVCKQAGLVFDHREPGFPCWCFEDDVGGYFNTPREAMESKERGR